jgi:hypothetical protein
VLELNYSLGNLIGEPAGMRSPNLLICIPKLLDSICFRESLTASSEQETSLSSMSGLLKVSSYPLFLLAMSVNSVPTLVCHVQSCTSQAISRSLKLSEFKIFRDFFTKYNIKISQCYNFLF